MFKGRCLFGVRQKDGGDKIINTNGLVFIPSVAYRRQLPLKNKGSLSGIKLYSSPLVVPKSCFLLGAQATFNHGASFCSLLPPLAALTTSPLKKQGEPLYLSAQRTRFLLFIIYSLLSIISRVRCWDGTSWAPSPTVFQYGFVCRVGLRPPVSKAQNKTGGPRPSPTVCQYGFCL